MSVAEHHLRARFGADLFDHRTFAIVSDGDLMEGVSHEAASLAGHLGIDRLVVVYDDNHITIDGPTDLAYSDDAAARFEAYGWHVDRVGEIAEDVDALEAALRRAMAVEGRPSLIVLRSHIGYPSPKVTDSNKAHGNPLGEDEIRVTKEILGIPPDEQFWVPDDVLAYYRSAGVRHRPAREAWEKRYAEAPARATVDACLQGRGLPGWEERLPTWKPGGDKIATRNASKMCVNAILDAVPGLVAGGADLTDNTGTALPDQDQFTGAHPAGRQIYYGIREHGMGAAMNGMALHGGIVPVGGTFLVFSDYMRGAVRLAAISEAHVVYSWTHDSVGLGEDGPTHQPIEHLAALRAMPGLRVIRPADANETATAWRAAVDGNGPTALILSRQNLPVLDGTAGNEGVLRGAYVLRDAPGAADVVLVATGSEVAVALDAATLLEAEGTATRVVSMPCWELFEEQDDAYRASVLPAGIARLSIEAASTFGWGRYADASVGIDRFGASAPGATVLDKLGINPTAVAERALRLIDR
jgi:transketolase